MAILFLLTGFNFTKFKLFNESDLISILDSSSWKSVINIILFKYDIQYFQKKSDLNTLLKLIK